MQQFGLTDPRLPYIQFIVNVDIVGQANFKFKIDLDRVNPYWNRQPKQAKR